MRLNQLQKMDPIQFEKFVGQLFRRMGLRVEDTQASADEGIDLVLRRGRKKAIVQCKRYQGSVGQPVIRDLYGSMLHTGSVEAYLVTTGTMTRAARNWVEDKPIHLVDGHRLVEWVRSGRLNYDTPPRLKGRTLGRTILNAILILLLIVSVYSFIPREMLDLGGVWQRITTLGDSVAVTAVPTDQALTSPPSDSDLSPTEEASTSPTQSPAQTATPLPINRDSSAPTE